LAERRQSTAALQNGASFSNVKLAETKSGDEFAGMLVNETGNSVTIVSINGLRQTILRLNSVRVGKSLLVLAVVAVVAADLPT